MIFFSPRGLGDEPGKKQEKVSEKSEFYKIFGDKFFEAKNLRSLR